MQLRALGTTDLRVSPVALGTWPIAGISSLVVNDADSLATVAACFEQGINFLDTAYCYGYEGESEKLIRQALGERRNEMVLATKGGVHWDRERNRVQDARPDTLRRECEESLRRLGTDRIELFYLHAPDPNMPVAESAGAIRDLVDEGKVLAAGASNVTVDQIEEFHAVCPLAALQPPYNMLQRGIEREIVPWCQRHDVSLMVFWPLMKGLLAGRMQRDHQLAPNDTRRNYPMFQGEEWQKNQDFLDELRAIADEVGKSVAQVVINWTIHQPGITTALCGAKRPEQIRETADAMNWQLSAEHREKIEAAITARGPAAVRRAV